MFDHFFQVGAGCLVISCGCSEQWSMMIVTHSAQEIEGSSTVVFDQMASSDVSTKLNQLRADVVGKVVLELRIFGPTVMTNLSGKNGTTWSKWQCTALDGSGQTALLRRSFFGNDQGDKLKAWNAQYKDGSVFSFKVLKGAKADKRFYSCTSPVELEVTDKTVITPVESSNIPWRPAISFGIAEVLAKDSDGRVDLLGYLVLLRCLCA